jgi:hypothetical protein
MVKRFNRSQPILKKDPILSQKKRSLFCFLIFFYQKKGYFQYSISIEVDPPRILNKAKEI